MSRTITIGSKMETCLECEKDFLAVANSDFLCPKCNGEKPECEICESDEWGMVGLQTMKVCPVCQSAPSEVATLTTALAAEKLKVEGLYRLLREVVKELEFANLLDTPLGEDLKKILADSEEN